jgi:hypothetical protein
VIGVCPLLHMSEPASELEKQLTRSWPTFSYVGRATPTKVSQPFGYMGKGADGGDSYATA